MNKELLNKLLSNTIEITNPDTEHYDYPETEQYVPVWWIKQVLKEETQNNKNNTKLTRKEIIENRSREIGEERLAKAIRNIKNNNE